MAFFDERTKNQLLFQNAKEFYNFVSSMMREMIPVGESKGLYLYSFNGANCRFTLAGLLKEDVGKKGRSLDHPSR